MKSRVVIVRTPAGFALAPVHLGEIIAPDQFEKLPEDEKQSHLRAIEEMQGELRAALEEAPRLEKEGRERIRKLIRQVAAARTGHLVGELKTKFADLPTVAAHLGALEGDVLDNIEYFLRTDEPEDLTPLDLAETGMLRAGARFRRYQVNLLIDHGETNGAPVLYEDNPTFQKLVGRIEHLSRLGASSPTSRSSRRARSTAPTADTSSSTPAISCCSRTPGMASSARSSPGRCASSR